MLTIVLTFTQKATAFTSVLKGGSSAMVNCPMVMMADEQNDNTMKCDSNMMSVMADCSPDCHFMTVVSVLHFILHERVVIQPQSRIVYPRGTTVSPYYFPESLYRPPFLS